MATQNADQKRREIRLYECGCAWVEPPQPGQQAAGEFIIVYEDGTPAKTDFNFFSITTLPKTCCRDHQGMGVEIENGLEIEFTQENLRDFITLWGAWELDSAYTEAEDWAKEVYKRAERRSKDFDKAYRDVQLWLKIRLVAVRPSKAPIIDDGNTAESEDELVAGLRTMALD